MNRGKRSVALDLKAPEGLEIARDLIARCEVLVENFRPGVAERLGISYEAARAINSGFVYLSISGFGQSGPLSRRPSYDLIAQAMAGMMSMTGEADGRATRVGDALGDLAAGLYGAWATAVALLGRERDGRGRHLDVAMFDAIFSFLPTPLSLFLFAGASPSRTGNHHAISTPFGSFRALDGDVIIAVANNALFHRLLAAMGRSDLRTIHDTSPTAAAPRTRPNSAPRSRLDLKLPVEEIVASSGRRASRLRRSGACSRRRTARMPLSAGFSRR